MVEAVNNSFDDKGEVHVMPPIELIERERVSYVREMQDYLQRLKSMNKREAQKKSFENLVQSEIIHESGEFTDHYEYTKSVLKKKKAGKKVISWR